MTQWFGSELIAHDCESQLLSLSPSPGARGPWRHLGLAAEECPHSEHPAPQYLPSSSGTCIFMANMDKGPHTTQKTRYVYT